MQLIKKHNDSGLVRDYVYNVMKKNIMELKMKPGQLISEKEIKEMLQVSRTPIREAFVQLAKEELIETIPQKGSFISLIDLKQVEESRFIRETLEATIVREACDALSAERVLGLEHLLSLQELAMQEKNDKRLFELDEEFHRSIIVGCGRVRTWELLQQMGIHYNRLRALRLSANQDWMTIITEHHHIVKAIQEKNPELAEQVIRLHLNRVVLEKEKLMLQYPGYFQ